MLEKFNPPGIVTPFNNAYHHAVVIPPNARILYIAGQVGIRQDGSLPDTLEGQAEQAWANVMACVQGAGMSAQNIVKITAYLVDADDYGAFAAARARHLGEARPASTAILIKGLLKPEWRYEIEAIAAAPA
ncbi:MAG: RidA family protein [Gammaproteobacteria bacterium]|nr:RidA family protein [Gammaproteobacteria bacterium]